jgi:fatty-acyl-CoA synthase
VVVDRAGGGDVSAEDADAHRTGLPPPTRPRGRVYRAGMKVPLTVRDFLDRAQVVYRERVAVVDEPDQPATSLGSLTFAALAARARAQAAGLDRLGIGAGERVAIVSQNAARLLAGFWGVSGWGRIWE